MSEVEFTIEHSTAQAEILKNIFMQMDFLDRDYLDAFAKSALNKASFYDSAAALNPMWSAQGSDVNKHRARVAKKVVDLLDARQGLLKALEAKKAADVHQEKIQNLFNI